jgi:subtilisin
MSEGDGNPGVERDADTTSVDADANDSTVDTDSRNETDSEGSGDREGEEPAGVGDDREKYVEVLARSGERTEHFESYLRHTTEAFLVSAEDSFPADRTTRYAKANLLRVEITQHHSLCFITTATTGDGETLDSLRTFRDDVLRSTAPGRALVGVYYRLSPPVARTLSRHPTARTTRSVRRLVEYSSSLERRRQDASSRSYRRVLAVVLTLVYTFGVCRALAGHVLIGLHKYRAGDLSANTET